MKITLEDSIRRDEFNDPTVMIDSGVNDLNIFEVFEKLIIPGLIAFGFAKESIEDACAEFAREEVDARNEA